MQAKRTIFPNKFLPYALLAPQLAVTLIFFIWLNEVSAFSQ